MTGARIKSTVDGSTKDLELTGCFIAIGHKPNTDIFAGQLEMEGGYIITQSCRAGNATATNIPGAFAAGDGVGITSTPGRHQCRNRLYGGAGC